MKQNYEKSEFILKQNKKKMNEMERVNSMETMSPEVVDKQLQEKANNYRKRLQGTCFVSPCLPLNMEN